MSEINTDQEIYEMAVTTHRSAEYLSKCYGFESVAQLAESLPHGAQVIDVGAGASPFGNEVATFRQDISWTNFDYSYQNPAILEDISKNAPSNIRFLAGDATKLDEIFEPETFDQVYSYWMLPHLSLKDDKPALRAAEAMLAITKTHGKLAIGPIDTRLLPRFEQGSRALHIQKEATASADATAGRIVSETKLSRSAAFRQAVANEVATPFFGTTQYTKRSEGKLHVFHPETQTYVPVYSLAAMKLSGKLAVRLVQGAHRARKSR